MPHPGYVPGNRDATTNDIALISLASPITALQPVTLVQPGQALPPPGSMVRIAGYGASGTGTDPNVYDDNRRRYAETRILSYGSSPLGASNMINVFFDDPHDPDDADDPDDGPSLAWQGQPGPGDSGGPMFMVMADGSLVQIGTVRGGGNGYGAIDDYVSVSHHLSWLDSANPLRSTTAAPGAIAWSDAAAWTDTLGRHETPSNVDGEVTGSGALGRYYDVFVSNASQLSLDMSPVVDRLIVANPGASVMIPSGRSLTAVVDSWLVDGRVAVMGQLNAGALFQTGGALNGDGAIAVAGGYHHLGGVLAPGSVTAPGVLTISGDYAQSVDATLAARVDGGGLSDRLVVTGHATLAGQLSLSAWRTAPVVGQTFTVVQAGVVDGEFAGVRSATLPAFTWATRVENGAVVVSVSGIDYADDVPAPRDPDDVPGQRSAVSAAGVLGRIAARIPVAEALEAAQTVQVGSTPFPTTMALGTASLNAMDERALGLALDTLPPSGFFGQSAFAVSTSRLVTSAITDRFVGSGDSALGSGGFSASVGGGVDAASAPFQGTGGTGGETGRTDPGKASARLPFGLFVSGAHMRSGGAAATAFTSSAITAGADIRPVPGLTFGFALTYVDDRRTADGMRFDSTAVAPSVYGQLRQGPWFVQGHAGHARLSSETRRSILFGSRMMSATASPKADLWQAGVVTGATLTAAQIPSLPDALSVTPFVGLDVAHVDLKSYTEQGAGALAVAVAGRTYQDVRASAGLELAWDMPIGGGLLTTRLRASLTQRFGDIADQAAAVFAFAPDLPFQLLGAQEARTYGTFGAAVGFRLDEAVSAQVSWQGDVSRSGFEDNRLSARLVYRFGAGAL